MPQQNTEQKYTPYEHLPYDVEIEQALLGAILISPEMLAIARAELEVENFYDPMHARLFAMLSHMEDEREHISPVTLHARMKADEGYVSVGGSGYLGNLVDGCPAPGTGGLGADVRQYVRMIVELWVRRITIVAVEDARDVLLGPDAAKGVVVSTLLKPLLETADRVIEREQSRGASVAVGDAAHALLREFDFPEEQGQPVMTGLAGLNKQLGGFFGGNVYILCGRTGMGKSIEACCLATAAAGAGVPVEIFSLEMSRRQLVARMLAELDFSTLGPLDKPLSYSRLLKRDIKPGEMVRAMAANDRLRDMPIKIHDDPSLNISRIRAIARARAAQHGPRGLLIIDHLQHIRPGDRYQGNRVSELGEITKAIKHLARQIGWPIVVLSQLSRAIESRQEHDRRPQLADLRQSGEIEEDADCVIGLFRPLYYIEQRREQAKSYAEWAAEYEAAKGVLEMHILKYRDGATGMVKFFVDPRASAVRDENPFANYDPAADLLQGL